MRSKPQLFNKFTDCIAAMDSISSSSLYGSHAENKALRECAALASFCLNKAQRFYVPRGAGILFGKKFTAEVRELLRLPFECTALLSEHKSSSESDWTISIAFTRKFGIIHRLPSDELLSSIPTDKPGYWIIKAYLTDGRWFPPLCGVFCETVQGISDDFINLYQFEVPPFHDSEVEVVDQMKGSAGHIANLCVMLSLDNVKSDEISAPDKINKKRLKCNKLPLLSYHVLEVDGERWDSPNHGTHTDSSGVRSHLRRGHVRRLHASERMVWVRASMVHGSRPGFVSKDYAMAGI